MCLVVARRVRPVLILPVRNSVTLAQAVSPVVPGFGASRNVGLSVLLMLTLDAGQDVAGERLDGLSVEHRVSNVAGHVGPPLFGTS